MSDPLLPDLPQKFTALWSHQIPAIRQITELFKAGHKIVVLDAPTGSGKSAIAEHVRRQLRIKALYVTVSKQLQSQLTNDFPYAKLIMGRANYPTLDDVSKTADDCDTWRPGCQNEDRPCRKVYPGAAHCSWCHSRIADCPYRVAKSEALAGPLAVANGAYTFGEWKASGEFKDWPLVIMDEWDRLEQVILNSLDVELNSRECWRFRVRPPERFEDVTPEWVTRLADAIKAEWVRTATDPPDDWNKLLPLADRLKEAAQGLQGKSWVVLRASREAGVSLGPISIEATGQEVLWSKAQRWLLMSATAIDSRWRLRMLGWTDPVPVVRVPSTYPVQNRPVYVWPVAPMVFKEREKSLPLLAQAIAKILRVHAQDRVLIHSGTYAIAAALYDALRSEFASRLVTFQSARFRDEALSRYLTREASVLIGPAMESGLDLPDAAGRVAILCRVPYPFRGDPRIEARSKLPGWWIYQAIETIASIVQASGRVVRHRNDFGTVWILDAQFVKIRQHGLYAPRWPVWWRAALKDSTGP